MKVYIEPADWWIGYYRGPNHHYVCPLPCIVIRWARRQREHRMVWPDGSRNPCACEQRTDHAPEQTLLPVITEQGGNYGRV